MTKSTKDLIKEKFKAWGLPMGPFIEITDIVQDMNRFADYIGDEQADEFVESLIWMIDNDYPHGEVIYEFMEIYLRKHSAGAVSAIIKHLTPQGPPLLVEMLGATKDKQAMDYMIKIIDLTIAKEDLLIATIGALGETGGANALKELQNIQETFSSALSQKAVLELETAISNIGKE